MLTLTERQEGYGAASRSRASRQAGCASKLDERNEKLGYKIREAQLEKVPYMLVVGDREAAERKVAPRTRSGEQLPVTSVEDLASRLVEEAKQP